jgi:hypothetical protein
MATTLADHSVDSREPQPSSFALLLGGKRRIENVRLNRRVHPDACV